MVTIRSVNKDRWPRQGGCHFGHPCQVGGAAGSVLYSLAGGESWGTQLWSEGNRRGHLGSIGQVSRVQGRPERYMHMSLVVDIFACGGMSTKPLRYIHTD